MGCQKKCYFSIDGNQCCHFEMDNHGYKERVSSDNAHSLTISRLHSNMNTVHRRSQSYTEKVDKMPSPVTRSNSFSRALKRLSITLRVNKDGDTDLILSPKQDPTDMDIDQEITKGILKTSKSNKRAAKNFRFNEIVLVGEAIAKEDYDRTPDFVLRLTPDLAMQIKQELNEFKTKEMPVHESSARFTHFFKM